MISTGLLADAGNFGLSFILEIVAIVIVIGIVAKYVAPPLNRMMNHRLDAITGELTAGERARAAAAEVVAARRASLEATKLEAATILEQARRGAERLVEEGRRAASEEYERTIVRAHAEVEASRTRVRAEVMAEAGRLVVAAAEAVVERSLDGTRHHRLIAEAIAATEAEQS